MKNRKRGRTLGEKKLAPRGAMDADHGRHGRDWSYNQDRGLGQDNPLKKAATSYGPAGAVDKHYRAKSKSKIRKEFGGG